MKKEENEIREELRTGVRAELEAWLRRRHWIWIVLILLVAGGYVELPFNIPGPIDDWLTGFVAVIVSYEAWRRAKVLWNQFVDRLHGRHNAIDLRS